MVVRFFVGIITEYEVMAKSSGCVYIELYQYVNYNQDGFYRYSALEEYLRNMFLGCIIATSDSAYVSRSITFVDVTITYCI